jgi:hypothetical protein
MSSGLSHKPGDPEFFCWWPDEGYTREDAVIIRSTYWHRPDSVIEWLSNNRVNNHEDAAEQAAHYDFSNCDGWERGDNEQIIMVEDEQGVKKRFKVHRDFEPVFTVEEESEDGESSGS